MRLGLAPSLVPGPSPVLPDRRPHGPAWRGLPARRKSRDRCRCSECGVAMASLREWQRRQSTTSAGADGHRPIDRPWGSCLWAYVQAALSRAGAQRMGRTIGQRKWKTPVFMGLAVDHDRHGCSVAAAGGSRSWYAMGRLCSGGQQRAFGQGCICSTAYWSIPLARASLTALVRVGTASLR